MPWTNEGFAALSHLTSYGLPVADVAYQWTVLHGAVCENFWRITFFKTMEDRADDVPTFLWGYQAQ